MPLRVDGLVRGVDLNVAALEPRLWAPALAAHARAAVAEAVLSGEGSPFFTRYVNGVAGASEDLVRPPGPIVYRFSWMHEIAIYAVAYLRRRWPIRGPGGGPGFPEKGGHYIDTHAVYAGGRRWDGRSEIPAEAELVVVNRQPYARKAHVGARGFLLFRRLYEDVRQAVQRQFRDLVWCEIRFITLAGGYVLKGSGPVRQAAQTARSSAFRAGRATLSPKNDRRRGQPLTYPALVVNLRD